MKIKLQDYSLISNEKLRKLIGDEFFESGLKLGTIIPSEKLADVCFESGEKRGYELPALQMRAIPISEAENLNKQDFLNSEIEIQ